MCIYRATNGGDAQHQVNQSSINCAFESGSGSPKVCEEYHAKTAKFKNFQGVCRPMNTYSNDENNAVNKFWLSFWNNSFLTWGIPNLFSSEGQAQFRARVNQIADFILLCSLALIIETAPQFSVLQVVMAAIIGYYVSAATFAIAHMSLHSRVLDYHWSGCRTAFYVFAYIHHRSPHSADTFTSQLLIMCLPSIRQKGRMWYEYFKYASLFYLCCQCSHTRLLTGWFLLSWIMEAGSHHHAHGHTKGLPRFVRLLVCFVYAPLGLCPSKEHHKKHHDYSQDTRFSNFTDLNTPALDFVLNHVWDWAYRRYYEIGQLHDSALSLSDSWIVFLLNFTGLACAWSGACIVGVNATQFCIWMPIFTHAADPLRLLRSYRNIMKRFGFFGGINASRNSSSTVTKNK
ncbi:expressed unknown protein [Seminavis robusta]|uniref:Fatty acid desaturase domain-containing protein n=1 Tax=Seminavis robusta TaxID=568900 RepID=A0A9N8EM61_9STRA|nr:expressed unknown protein [Seminavis robusta]|eukprot:Sro1208_g252560.1 n/a (401) ;mRNA; f:7696-8898